MCLGIKTWENISLNNILLFNFYVSYITHTLIVKKININFKYNHGL